MARTLKARDLYETMGHALGSGHHSQQLRDQDLANDVLEQVASMHGWSFLEPTEAYIDLRGMVLFSGFDWTAASKTLSDPTPSALFAAYSAQPGDFVRITAGATASYHKIASRPSDDSLVLETSIAAGNLAGTVAGQVEPRSAVLPADFRELVYCSFDKGNAYVSNIRLVSAQVVARYQDANTPLLSEFYAAAERVVLSTGETRHLLRLAPVTASGQLSALHILYERRIPAIEGDSDVVRVPEYCYLLVKQVARAWIRGLEMPRTWGSYESQLAEIMASPVFELAKRADDGVSEEIGHIRGGRLSRPESALEGWDLGGNISIGGPVTP